MPRTGLHGGTGCPYSLDYIVKQRDPPDDDIVNPIPKWVGGRRIATSHPIVEISRHTPKQICYVIFSVIILKNLKNLNLAFQGYNIQKNHLKS